MKKEMKTCLFGSPQLGIISGIAADVVVVVYQILRYM